MSVLVSETPGVRMLVVKNALGGVAARIVTAESSRARTYGSACVRVT